MAKRIARFEPPDLPAAGAIVTALLRSPAAPGELTIKLGRKIAGNISEKLAADHGIGEGVIWTDRMRDAASAFMLEAQARDWAARAVARRSMSRVMLTTKLRQRGLAPALATRIAEDLAAAGMIDEKRFAEGIAETTLTRRAVGTRLLANKLRAKGINQRTAGEVAERVAAEMGYDPQAAATDLARRKLRSLSRKSTPADPKARQGALYALLARRGFDSDLCRQVVRTVLTE